MKGKSPPCPHEVGEVSEPLIPTSIILGWGRWGSCYQARGEELEGPWRGLEGLEQGPSHKCGSCVTSALGTEGLPDQVLPICWRKQQTTHDRTHFSGCQGEAVGVQRGGGVESVVELVLSVCYTQSGGFGVWFSYFT